MDLVDGKEEAIGFAISHGMKSEGSPCDQPSQGLPLSHHLQILVHRLPT